MNNYTKFPNDILEALPRYDFSPLEWSVIMYVIRKTYGWDKKADTISVRKMATDTGHDLRGMQRAVKKLQGKNVLTVSSRGSRGMPVIGINKPATWGKPTVKQPTVKQPTVKRPGVYGQATVGSDGQISLEYDGQVTNHNIYTDTKKTNTKESAPPPLVETGAAVACDSVWVQSDLPEDELNDDSLWT